MTSLNIDNLVKAILGIILLSISIGEFPRLQEFALKEGIRAITYQDYRSTQFFGKKHGATNAYK